MTVQAAREARSVATRRRILDATIEVLVERGYGGTSTLEVQQRAGVSRGALLHHYNSRTELLIAAVDHLTKERLDDFAKQQEQAPADDRMEWAIRQIWTTFQGPMYSASLELWLAARHDPTMREAMIPHERTIGQMVRDGARDWFGPTIASHPGFLEAFELLIDAMRGAAARSILRTSDPSDRLITSWVKLMRQLLD